MEVKYDGIHFKSDGPISGSFQTEDSKTPLKITTDDTQLLVYKVIYKIAKKYDREVVVITQEEVDNLLSRGEIEIIKKDEVVSSNSSRLGEIE